MNDNSSDSGSGPKMSRRGADLTRPIGHIVLEAALVALGVILALAANEWRQGVKARETADQALASIHAELVFNREALDEALQYHTMLADTLMAHLRSGRTPTHGHFERGYISPAMIQTNAWDTARETNALAPLPYERVLALAGVYSLLGSYQTQKESSGRVIYEALFREGPQAVISRPSNLMSIHYTFIYKEQQLLERFDAFLEEWES